MQNLQEGEASVPQKLLDFLLILIAGNSQKRKKKSKMYSSNLVLQKHRICCPQWKNKNVKAYYTRNVFIK